MVHIWNRIRQKFYNGLCSPLCDFRGFQFFPFFVHYFQKEIIFRIRIVDHREETVIDPVGIGNDVAFSSLAEDLSQPDDREYPTVNDILQNGARTNGRQLVDIPDQYQTHVFRYSL